MRNLQWVTIVAAAIAASSPAQAQQKFPTKPIRLVVGYGVGGLPDTLARLIGQKMSESWKQAVVIENRGGGGGTLAALQVLKATPDGHTLLYAGANLVSSTALQAGLPYDPLKDFAGISRTGFAAFVLVVAPALGVKSVHDLIALAKAQPGKLILASTALGSANHLSAARFNQIAGIKVVTVAFKGGPEPLLQIMGGRAHFSIVTLTVGLPFIRDGKLQPLAVTSPQRWPMLPDVPALAETLAEFKQDASGWGGLLAPAATPRPIVNQISKEVGRILTLPDIKERLLGLGIIPAPTTPEEYDRILREQIGALSKLVVDIGLKAK